MFLARVMVIAGSDSGGGAGLQADLMAVAVLGGRASTVVTVLTAQNSLGVQGFWPVPPKFVAAQFRAVANDIGLDAVKTGILPTAAHVVLVAELLAPLGAPLVVDPVLAASTGQGLMEPAALEVLKTRLLPLASLVTPNLAEAQALTGLNVQGPKVMARAARVLVEMGARAALVKGGHLAGEPVDVLFDGRREHYFSAPRLPNAHTHGTGCTLASALATLLASGWELKAAVERARLLVRRAIAAGLPLGAGRGPVRILADLEHRLKEAAASIG
ncbi:Hydroxymethylpyrimidine/phosphomethylpyrimidine kinase [Desulfarculales bacterium]